ncbi:MAG: Flp pilus assembly protein CpaB [Rhodobacteraceae bacterium]|nr:Flp pilus assembly protein CpaB [Paracoccaceae bacterium]
MRLVFLFVLVIGIGTAGYATLLIKNQFSGYQVRVSELENELRATREKVVETTPVVVSSRALTFAHKLVVEDLAIIQWPSSNLPENIFTSIEALVGDEGSQPRYIKRTIDPGEPMLSSKVTNFGEDIGVTTLLEPGTRAFAIRVDVASGVSGFIQPGDEVDIYWTGNNLEQVITKLVLEKVKVVAIDQQADQDSQRPTVATTVTVQVFPNVVANLVQFQSSGSLTLALRGAEDTTISGNIEVNTNTLIGNEIIVVVPEQVCTRTVRRGVEVVVTEVPCASLDADQ